MQDIIDLDALQPKDITIRFKGEDITLSPPRLSYVLALSTLASDLKDAEGLTSEQLLVKVDALKNHLYTLIPGLKDAELNMQQITVLIKAITDMTVPPDAKELKDRGIEVDGSKKAE